MQNDKIQILVKKIKESCIDTDLIELISLNSALMDRAFYSYKKRYPKCYDLKVKDFNDNKPYIVYQAILTYDSSKSRFTTHLVNYCKYYCLYQVAHCLPRIESSDKEEQFLMDVTEIKEPKNTEILAILKKYVDGLTNEKIKKILQMRYFSDQKKTFKEIASCFNYSPQRIEQLHQKGIKMLRKKFNAKSSCIFGETVYNK